MRDEATPPTPRVERFGKPESKAVAEVNIVRYSGEIVKENFRGLIAICLICLMAGIVVASFVLFWAHPDRIAPLKDFFGFVFGPIVALVGTVTGYYFGSQSANKQ